MAKSAVSLLNQIDDILSLVGENVKPAKKKTQIVVCGGGNGAHVFAGLAASNPDNRVHWLSLYADEAARIAKELEINNGMTVNITSPKRTVRSKPTLVTKDASLAIPNSDVIIICVPAFAHSQYLNCIAEYANQPCVLSVFPAAAGFEFAYLSTFANAKHVDLHDMILVACETLPWACRIQAYGHSVEIVGTKDNISAWSHGSHTVEDALHPVEVLQQIIGDCPRLSVPKKEHVLSATVGAINATVHPTLMYMRWREWDGTPLPQKPLFYHGIDAATGDALDELSAEVQLIVTALNKALGGPQADKVVRVPTVYEMTMQCYGKQTTDHTTTYGLFVTNEGWKGLTHPMLTDEASGGFVPDFKYRYLAEDIPMGLIVLKGIALLCDVKTPLMDKMIDWAQTKINKEYWKPGTTELSGKDMAQTRAPQHFGFLHLSQLLKQLEA